MLAGNHANINIPKVIGAARAYELTGEPRYRIRRALQYTPDEFFSPFPGPFTTWDLIPKQRRGFEG